MKALEYFLKILFVLALGAFFTLGFFYPILSFGALIPRAEITVAIIDTGIDTRHPELQKNLWINPKESGRDHLGRDKATNGVDDDGNGFIDDVHGWNFVANNNDLTDHHGHGTHIAGIIGLSEKIQVSIEKPQIRFMTLKYFDPNSSPQNTLDMTVEAIKYAVKMKADIINYSGGGLVPSLEEKEAVQLALKAGILFVAAAGNEASNSDIKGYYPANYDLPNILSITATDRHQSLLPSSNFGVKSVDMAAPGKDILSTLPKNSYGPMTGTSQATAFATGTAALLMAQNPYLLKKPEEIIEHLALSGTKDPLLLGKTKFQTRLNTTHALALQAKGVGAFGIKAQNTASIDPLIFSSPRVGFEMANFEHSKENSTTTRPR